MEQVPRLTTIELKSKCTVKHLHSRGRSSLTHWTRDPERFQTGIVCVPPTQVFPSVLRGRKMNNSNVAKLAPYKDHRIIGEQEIFKTPMTPADLSTSS